MILHTRAELLSYFGARDCGVLERQFNGDGRLIPILIDVAADAVLVAQTKVPNVLSTFTFPFHVSDFLGQIELDRQTAEQMVAAA